MYICFINCMHSALRLKLTKIYSIHLASDKYAVSEQTNILRKVDANGLTLTWLMQDRIAAIVFSMSEWLVLTRKTLCKNGCRSFHIEETTDRVFFMLLYMSLKMPEANIIKKYLLSSLAISELLELRADMETVMVIKADFNYVFLSPFVPMSHF